MLMESVCKRTTAKQKSVLKDILNYAERFQKKNCANMEMILHTNPN